jgi:3-hydroxyacyl-CoA dehydrogenase
MKTEVSIGKNGHVALIQVNQTSDSLLSASVPVIKKRIVSQAQAINLDPNVKAIIVAYAGRTFMAGGDVNEADLDGLFAAMPELSNT